MKCPLFYAGLFAHGGMWEVRAGDCLFEGCAWYIKDCGRCAILELALTHNLVIDALDDIRDKMPHEKQFRR